MNLLITGGAGFIGSHLADALLRDGHRVVCVDNLSLGKMENIAEAMKHPQFSFVQLDVVEQKSELETLFAKHSFNGVFHLAANSDIQRGGKDPSLDLNRTFLTTFCILDSMRRHAVRDIIFASSSAIYGPLEGKLHEASGPLFPVSLYGAGKLASEGFITAFAESFHLRSWIIRFPNVIGPRATHGVLFDFIARLRQNSKELTILGDGKQAKPYLYVTDLVEAMLFAWKTSAEKNNCFNVGVASHTTVDEIAKIIVEEMKLNGVRFRYSGGAVGWVGDVPHFEYDLSKIAKLGWKAARTSTEAVRLAARELLR